MKRREDTTKDKSYEMGRHDMACADMKKYPRYRKRYGRRYGKKRYKKRRCEIKYMRQEDTRRKDTRRYNNRQERRKRRERT